MYSLDRYDVYINFIFGKQYSRSCFIRYLTLFPNWNLHFHFSMKEPWLIFYRRGFICVGNKWDMIYLLILLYLLYGQNYIPCVLPTNRVSPLYQDTHIYRSIFPLIRNITNMDERENMLQLHMMSHWLDQKFAEVSLRSYQTQSISWIAFLDKICIHNKG